MMSLFRKCLNLLVAPSVENCVDFNRWNLKYSIYVNKELKWFQKEVKNTTDIFDFLKTFFYSFLFLQN